MLYRKYLKRLFDLIFSLILIILTCPVSICCAIVLLFVNKGKIFFIQPRPGKDGKIFFIIKFRTMNEKRDKNGNMLPDIYRITFLGRFIRKSSIDEIPQLINVLLGDLSIIGPRPLLVEYLALYNGFQRRRHEVRPGITGWAQINGRNAITWDDKFKLDVYYVDNLSFMLDLKILLKTVSNVVKRSDIYNTAGNTMEKFNGSNR